MAGSGRRFSGRRPPRLWASTENLRRCWHRGPQPCSRGPSNSDAERPDLRRVATRLARGACAAFARGRSARGDPPLPTASSVRPALTRQPLSGPQPPTFLMLLQGVDGRFSWRILPANRPLHCSLMVGSPGSELRADLSLLDQVSGSGLSALNGAGLLNDQVKLCLERLLEGPCRTKGCCSRFRCFL